MHYMSPEMGLLRLFVRDAEYVQRAMSVLEKVNLDTDIKLIFDVISKYYEVHSHHQFMSKDEMLASLAMNYTYYKGYQQLVEIVHSIYDLEVSDSLCRQLLVNLLEKHYATQITQTVTSIVGGNEQGTLKDILPTLEEFLHLASFQTEDEDSIFETRGIEEIESIIYDTNGIKWRSAALQTSLGNLCGGTLIHIAARPEVGKTAFLCSEASYWTRQLKDDETILWVNNEEAAIRIRHRLYCALLNKPVDEIQQKQTVANTVFHNMGGNKIKLLSDRNMIMSVSQIHELCKKYKPRVLILDHADKFSYKGSSHVDIPVRLRELFRQYREISKKYHTAVIAVGHASTDAEGKKWIEMDHLDYSKTGKGAEVDVVIGIGKTTKEEEQQLRYINLPKNKLTGMHSRLTMRINTNLSRYYDLGVVE